MPHLRAMTPAAAGGKALGLGTSLACKGQTSEAPARDRSWAISVSLAARADGGKALDCAGPTPGAAPASPTSRRRSAPVAPIAGIAAPPMSQPGSVGQPGRLVVRPAHAPAQRHPPYLRTPSRLPIGSLRPKSRRFRGTSASSPPGRYAGCPGPQALPLAGVHGSVLACRPSSQSGADVATTLL